MGRLYELPARLFGPLGEAVENAIAARGRWAWSNNHRSGRHFTYFYLNALGTTDANTENVEGRLFAGRSDGYRLVAEVWRWMKGERYGEGAELRRLIAYVHPSFVEEHPHISLLDRPGELTVVVYLNQEWSERYNGATCLYTHASDWSRVSERVLPMPMRVFEFPANQPHEVERITGTQRSNVSLVFRVKPDQEVGIHA